MDTSFKPTTSNGVLEALTNVKINESNWKTLLENTIPSPNIEDRRNEVLPKWMTKTMNKWTKEDLDTYMNDRQFESDKNNPALRSENATSQDYVKFLKEVREFLPD